MVQSGKRLRVLPLVRSSRSYLLSNLKLMATLIINYILQDMSCLTCCLYGLAGADAAVQVLAVVTCHRCRHQRSLCSAMPTWDRSWTFAYAIGCAVCSLRRCQMLPQPC